jgi:hypothetical protein
MKLGLRFAFAPVVTAFALLAGCSSGADGGGTPGGWGPGSTVAPLNGGIGEICSTATACPTGLDCRFDDVDWISHHQCTTSCAADSDCTAKFGNHTMCIGAGICVSKCLDDTDCPKGTLCSTENGWCENTGPGSGVPKCEGTPTPCDLLTTECASSPGCTSSGECTGASPSCLSRLSDVTCAELPGCYWNTAYAECEGVSRACSSNFDQVSCIEEPGCSWSATCSGTTTSSCASQSAALCEHTFGCALIPQ